MHSKRRPPARPAGTELPNLRRSLIFHVRRAPPSTWATPSPVYPLGPHRNLGAPRRKSSLPSRRWKSRAEAYRNRYAHEIAAAGPRPATNSPLRLWLAVLLSLTGLLAGLLLARLVHLLKRNARNKQGARAPAWLGWRI